MLRGDITFDPLFIADTFFKPVNISHSTKLSFFLPQSKTTLVTFFRENQIAYQEGIKILVERLKTVAKTHHLLDVNAHNALNSFLQKFNFPEDATPFYIDTMYPLLTDGVKMLANIIDDIEKDKDLSETKKMLITDLLDNIGYCAPAVNTILSDTALALSNDCKTELMSIRRQIAQQVAKDIIRQLDLKPGTFPHYTASLLNAYHNEIGISFDNDAHSNEYTATHEMQNDFIALLSNALNASAVIEEILKKHSDQLKKTMIDQNIISWLNRYGLDDTFKIEQIATLDENDNYVAKPHIDYLYMHALLKRLHNSKLLNMSAFQKHTLESYLQTNFFISAENNIKLAYVETKNNLTEPFVLFYLQQFLTQAKNGENLTTTLESICNAKQRDELREQIRHLVIVNWPEWVTTLAPDEIEKIMILFNEKFPDATEEQQFMFNTVRLHDVVVSILISADRLTPANALLILDILINEDHSDGRMTLLSILDLFINEEQALTQLIDDLLAAGKHAKSLAKAIGLVYAANIFDDDVIAFFKKHVEHAGDFADIMVFFKIELNIEIDAKLLTFLADNKTYARDFAAFLRNKQDRGWLNHLIEQHILDVKCVKSLIKHAEHLSLIINTCADLFTLDKAILTGKINLLIENAGRMDLLNFIRIVADRCINFEIPLSNAELEKIILQDGFHYIKDDNELAFYAAMLGLNELLDQLIKTHAVEVSAQSPFGSGATLLAIAMLYASADTVDMLIKNGANAEEPIKLKVYVLETAIPENKQRELMEFLKTHSGNQAINSDDVIMISANEIAKLLQEKIFAPEHARTFGVFAQGKEGEFAKAAKLENTVSLDKK